MATLTLFAGDKVPEADGGECDDHEVDGLQRAPALDVLEDDGGQRHEDQAAKQGEEHRGEDAHLGLADLPLLWASERERERGRGGDKFPVSVSGKQIKRRKRRRRARETELG